MTIPIPFPFHCLICIYSASSVAPVPQNPLCTKDCKRQGTIKSGFCGSEFGRFSGLNINYSWTIWLTGCCFVQWSRERWPLWPTGQEELLLSAFPSSRPTRLADWPSHKWERPCRWSCCHSAGSARYFGEVHKSYTPTHWLLALLCTVIHNQCFFTSY